MNFHAALLDEVQGYTIGHAAWRGTDRVLAERLAKTLGEDREAEIRRHLHSKPLQAALEGRDVLLWVGADDLVRLVDAQPSSREVAAHRLAHHPGPDSCRLCLMREPRSLQSELQPEVDGRGEHVDGSFVHPQCAVAWSRLRQIAERGAA